MIPGPAPQRRTIAELVPEILEIVLRMAQGELDMARAEISNGLRRMRTGALLIGVGAGVAIIGIFVLAQAAVAALVRHADLPPDLAALLVGGGALILAAASVWWGMAALSPKNLIPDRALHHLRRTAQSLTERIHHDASS